MMPPLSGARAVVLSDLHLLEPHNDDRYPIFLQVLRKIERDPSVSHLILLGDIFDILIGSFKFWTEIHREFFELLTKVQTAGKKVVWVQGNHDFQIAPLVASFDIHWIAHHEVVELAGVRIYLSHGDLADWKDKLHPLWRAFLTSRLLGWALQLLPNWFAKKVFYPLTLKLSQSSRVVSQSRDRTQIAREIFKAYALKCGQKHEAQLVLLGHSHLTEQHIFPGGIQYLNVGSWFAHDAQVGELHIADGQVETKLFPVASWLHS